MKTQIALAILALAAFAGAQTITSTRLQPIFQANQHFSQGDTSGDTLYGTVEPPAGGEVFIKHVRTSWHDNGGTKSPVLVRIWTGTGTVPTQATSIYEGALDSGIGGTKAVGFTGAFGCGVDEKVNIRIDQTSASTAGFTTVIMSGVIVH